MSLSVTASDVYREIQSCLKRSPSTKLPLKLRHWKRFGSSGTENEMNDIQKRIRQVVSEQIDLAKNEHELKRNIEEMLVTYECLFEEVVQDCDELKKRIAAIFRSAQRGHRITKACGFLGVARSPYYHGQHKTQAARNDEHKAELIRQVHEASFFTFGGSRVGKALETATGLRLGESQLGRLM